jgi:hypothetical protein
MENPQDFLSVAMEFLFRHPGTQVMIMVEAPNGGFETLQTNTSFVWSFGMLRMAEEVFRTRLAEVRNLEFEAEVRRREEKSINAAIVEKGKSN